MTMTGQSDFDRGWAAGMASAAAVARLGAERIADRPPCADYERDGPRARGVAIETLVGLADDLEAAARGDTCGGTTGCS